MRVIVGYGATGGGARLSGGATLEEPKIETFDKRERSRSIRLGCSLFVFLMAFLSQASAAVITVNFAGLDTTTGELSVKLAPWGATYSTSAPAFEVTLRGYDGSHSLVGSPSTNVINWAGIPVFGVQIRPELVQSTVDNLVGVSSIEITQGTSYGGSYNDAWQLTDLQFEIEGDSVPEPGYPATVWSGNGRRARRAQTPPPELTQRTGRTA